MDVVIRFAILGLGIGAVYAIFAQGLVVIYRGSGTVNFAQGAIGMVPAFLVYDELSTGGKVPPIPVCIAIGVGVGGLLGVAQYLLVMRPARRSSPLTRLVATLGVMLLLQAAAALRYGGSSKFVRTFLPAQVYRPFDGITVTQDRLILLAVGLAATALLWALYRFTLFGRATSTCAESDVVAASLGWSADKIALINWFIGGSLAGLAGILVVPLTGLQVSSLSLLIVTAVAAALIGGFKSFPLTLAGALAIGIVESEASRFVHIEGSSRAIPLVLIILTLVLTGKSIPIRGFMSDRLPSVGTGRVRPPAVGIGLVGGGLIIWQLASESWVVSITASLILVLVLLSIVVLTGYAGQVSLAQWSLAGVGAYVSGRLVAETDVPLGLALILAVLAAIPIGILFALPAVRTRGVSLAIVTLSLAAAGHALVFGNFELTGGETGTVIGPANLFGINIDPIEHPERYATAVGIAVTLAMLVVSRVRRSVLGHRMLAVRANERAAASMGVNVAGTKVTAFVISAMLAALGGVFSAFQGHAVQYSGYDVLPSIFLVAYAVIGGVGYVGGALFAGVFASGGVGARLLNEFGALAQYLELIAAVFVVLNVLTHPDGMVSFRKRTSGTTSPAIAPEEKSGAVAPTRSITPTTLELRGVSIGYGSVTILRDVDFVVRTGEVVGLIGPNGAGKTSLIDAITGFVPLRAGSIELGGRNISRLVPHRRARAGIARSFQAVELFDDLSVAENLSAAESGNARFGSIIRSLMWPDRDAQHGEETMACLRDFGLEPLLSRRADELPTAHRRICGIARALAGSPIILMLDEPAAGLGEDDLAELAQLLRRLAEVNGLAVVLIEHHVGLVTKVCDRIYVLDGGTVLATGTPAQITSDPRVVAAYLGGEAALEVAERSMEVNA